MVFWHFRLDHRAHVRRERLEKLAGHTGIEPAHVTAVKAGRAAHSRTGDGGTGGKSSPARKYTAKKKAGETQAAVARGETDSVKDATARLWAPAQGMIAHSRKPVNKRFSGLEVVALEYLLNTSAEAQLG